MAVPAEVLIQTYPNQVIEQAEPLCFDADLIGELAFARRRYRQQAEDILRTNHGLLMDGEWEAVPIPVDALGTGRKATQNRNTYGEDSPQYQESLVGLTEDCERLYGEAERKNTFEYFIPSVQYRNDLTGDYFSKGNSLTELVSGGLSPVAKKGEQHSRIDDFVEEMTYKAIGSMQTDGPVSTITFLECPDWVIEEYKENPEGTFYGYVPEVEKLMLRGLTFYNDEGIRIEEQLALPGTYITHEVVLAVLEEAEYIEPESELSKADIHAKQFIEHGEGDVFAFAKLLDAKASQLSGMNIFLGEVVAENHPKDYASAKQEALERHNQRRSRAKKLGHFIIGHVEAGTDRWVAEKLVSKFVDEDLKAMSRANPELAELIYNKKTADGYRNVEKLRLAGKHDAANRLQARVEEEAPAPSYCGAGSCGLERVNPTSSDARKARELGLVGEQLHDTERACRGCGSKTIHYDSRGSKVCITCESAEIKE